MASWNPLPPSSSPVSSTAPFSSPPTRSGTLLDPFSANASGSWKPPRFAKRERSPDNSPTGSPVHKRRIRESSQEPIPATSSPFGSPERKYVTAVPRSPIRESLREKEERLWEDTVSQLFESGMECSIDLSGRGLTFISPDIENLSKIVRFSCLPASPTLSRAASLPTNQVGVAPQRQRVSTTSTSIANHAKGGITPVQLFLSNNDIRMLPAELFRVENLTVLAIRNNKLTSIPSAIGALKNLNELVISGNAIQFLPSEIERLPLRQLALHPNKWLECPESKGAGTNVLSSLESMFTIPSLQELCMRTLLSFPGGSSATVIEQDKDLKIKMIRPDLARYIDATCTRKIIDARSQEFTQSKPTTKEESDPKWDLRYSICPNREHGIGVRRTFINPAEIRYRWVRQIGVADTGGHIPLRYRGCERGCLGFLEDAFYEEGAEEPGDDDIVF